jgi:hypothetical protein
MAGGQRNLFHAGQLLFQNRWSVIYTLQRVIVIGIATRLGTDRRDTRPRLKAVIK